MAVGVGADPRDVSFRIFGAFCEMSF